MEIRIELPGVKLGWIEADHARVNAADPRLSQLLEEVCLRKRREFTTETLLAEAETTRAVRTMFRQWGIDPSKYRPSSEALLRRVVQGKGLYRVSNVVDIGNLGSVETGWPYGCYDRRKICPPVLLRHGSVAESYEGIGKRVWHLAGRPVLVDREGPFGSPISDSTRSMITEVTREILVMLYVPAITPAPTIEAAIEQVTVRLSQFAGAQVVHSGLIG